MENSGLKGDCVGNLAGLSQQIGDSEGVIDVGCHCWVLSFRAGKSARGWRERQRVGRMNSPSLKGMFVGCKGEGVKYEGDICWVLGERRRYWLGCEAWLGVVLPFLGITRCWGHERGRLVRQRGMWVGGLVAGHFPDRPSPIEHPSSLSYTMSSPNESAIPSASAKKKLKRTHSPPLTANSINPNHHPLFRRVDDPDADVYLRSSDNILFAFPKFYLQASSQVFEDCLKCPLPLQPGEGAIRDGLPVIQLEESSNELELLLRYIHRRFRDRLPAELDDDTLDTLL